jgi:uncharacterized repeat protein (TIGR04138 family)
VSDQIKLDWKSIREKAGPYPQEAFQFVRDGLAHTVKTIHGADGDNPKHADRHVNGAQLCCGLRDFAMLRYGMLARLVLSRWGITRTDDFGRIVFAMIEAGLMRKSEEDSFEDFQAVYEFDEAFMPAEVA